MADNRQPFLPFFVGDFFAATALWEGEERALYMLLLAHQWGSGPVLPSNLERLSRALGYRHEKFMELWAVVKTKFRVRGEVLFNEGLENLREKLARARARERSGAWQTLRLEVFERDHFTCRYCGTLEGPFECDHVFPVSRGGTTALENLVTACAPCNRSKGNKTVEEWRRRAN